MMVHKNSVIWGENEVNKEGIEPELKESMPKQVRIRRGTTAQHAAFVGAGGEVTFDLAKKVRVLNGGSTPGDKSVEPTSHNEPSRRASAVFSHGVTPR
jgi:hypothetical protein